MIRRAISFLFLILFFTSCDYFSSTSTTSKNNLQLTGTVIDYTKVDVYPIFPDCENYAEEGNQKECFEQTLTQKLTELFNENDLKVEKAVNDSTAIDLLIDNTGKASVVSINSPESILTNFPALDSVIRQSFTLLPTMKPAVKRGIFVNSQYRLVVLVKTI